ncbi:hypothetical protein [Sorangium sp. So ce693]|uniref:hypothetical protein n=1 Tax=Sorangium sp. So ce693 TaxID=3133318 RepID=UPI003F6195DC
MLWCAASAAVLALAGCAWEAEENEGGTEREGRADMPIQDGYADRVHDGVVGLRSFSGGRLTCSGVLIAPSG